MTLTGMVTVMFFTWPPIVGAIAGQKAGGVGVWIGIGVGLAVGRLAYYASEKIYKYEDKLEARRDSRAQVVLKRLNSWSGVLVIIQIFGPPLMTIFFMNFIVHLMAG